jgi:mRNA interferase RelE/StbE
LSNGGWAFTARAGRDFKRLDRPVQRRVVDALDRLTDDPPAGDVVKLVNTDEWRLRVGDWRVRFTRDVETGVVYVVRVLPRGRAYRE